MKGADEFQAASGRQIRCPFVYSRGKQCPGHIVRVEAYKADLEWSFSADGVRSLEWSPRSHYHLFCSEKNSHAGAFKEDALKFYWQELPVELREEMLAARPMRRG